MKRFRLGDDRFIGLPMFDLHRWGFTLPAIHGPFSITQVFDSDTSRLQFRVI
jgi:hypothetical protein